MVTALVDDDARTRLIAACASVIHLGADGRGAAHEDLDAVEPQLCGERTEKDAVPERMRELSSAGSGERGRGAPIRQDQASHSDSDRTAD